MRRRQFIAVAAGLPVAGCSAMTRSKPLRSTDPVHGEGESSVRFLDGTREIGSFLVQYYHPYGERDPEIPFQLTVTHPEQVHIDAFRFTIDAPIDSFGPPIRLYLKRPEGSGSPALTYDEGRPEFRTIVAAEDLDRRGEGPFQLDFLGVPLDTPPSIDFAVRGELELSERDVLGATYTADTTIRFTVPRTAN